MSRSRTPTPRSSPNCARRAFPVFARWEDLLAHPAEAVWLPLPIPLHRPYTEQALAAGKAVLCEKPAAGCVQDLDAMQDAQSRAGLPVAIGFQDIYEPTTLALKRALLDGRDRGGPVGNAHRLLARATAAITPAPPGPDASGRTARG